MVTEIEHPARGRYATVGCPIRLSDSPVELRPAPLLGQHTEEVLTTLADCSADEVERFRREEVV